jgi:hypothetical protein
MSLIPSSGIKLSLPLINAINSGFDNLLIQSTFVFTQIWYNQDQVNCSPDKMIAALGTNAATFANISVVTQNYLNSLKPNSIVLNLPIGWTLTLNSDGTGVATYTKPA